MNIKSTDPTRSAAMHAPGFDFVPERSEAMLNLQKELLGTYEEASRAWLARVQSEVALWSGLAAKLAATRSVPDAVAAYQECVAQRMKMAADDGQRLADECQKSINKISRALSNGAPFCREHPAAGRKGHRFGGTIQHRLAAMAAISVERCM